ncbi:MAG: energy transducer TonB [Flavipsychrobacter sp.]
MNIKMAKTRKALIITTREELVLTLHKGKTAKWRYIKVEPYQKIEKDISEIMLQEPIKRKQLDYNAGFEDNGYVCELYETPSSFPGGDAKMKDFIKKQLHYPEDNSKNYMEGKVYVSFRVLKDGNISDVTITKGLTEPYNNEALRIVSLFPKFDPARQNGKKADSYFCLPISFLKVD